MTQAKRQNKFITFKQLVFVFVCFFSGLSPVSTLASELPASLQVILISKILSYEASLSKKEQVSIYIIASPEIYRSFYKLKTKGYSEIKIDKLEIGAQLPDPGFDLVYVADEKLIGQAIEYATANHALLISSHSSWVKKGITLGFGATDGRPKFYLNLTTSTASGLQWDDKILSIAQTVR